MKKLHHASEWEAIVLAGGLGTRLRSAIGEDTPKPMAPIHGRPFLEYLLEYWIKQGVNRFILSVAYKHELIRKHFQSQWQGASIGYAVDEGWGTGGGLLKALPLRKNKQNPFLVINGDTYFEVPLESFYDFHCARSSQASLTLLDLPNAAGGRVNLDSTQKVISFDAAPSKDGKVNGGVYLFESDYFSKYTGPEKFSLERDFLMNSSLRGNSCYGFECAGHFRDIGTPETYRSCEQLFESLKGTRE